MRYNDFILAPQMLENRCIREYNFPKIGPKLSKFRTILKEIRNCRPQFELVTSKTSKSSQTLIPTYTLTKQNLKKQAEHPLMGLHHTVLLELNRDFPVQIKLKRNFHVLFQNLFQITHQGIFSLFIKHFFARVYLSDSVRGIRLMVHQVGGWCYYVTLDNSQNILVYHPGHFCYLWLMCIQTCTAQHSSIQTCTGVLGKHCSVLDTCINVVFKQLGLFS